MTFSHFSKDPLRPPVSEGQLTSVVFAVVTDCPLETGGTRSVATEGVDGFIFSFSVFHASAYGDALKQGLILIPPAVANPDLSPNTYDDTKT